MNNDDTTYRITKDFDPYTAIDAVRGLTDAIHHILLEGAGTEACMDHGDRAGLNALVELLQGQVHALHGYLTDIRNQTTLRLPICEADFDEIHVKHGRPKDIKEPMTLYAVR